MAKGITTGGARVATIFPPEASPACRSIVAGMAFQLTNPDAVQPYKPDKMSRQ